MVKQGKRRAAGSGTSGLARVRHLLLGAFVVGVGTGCPSAADWKEEYFVEPSTGRGYRLVEHGASRAEPGTRPLLLVLHPYAYPAAELVESYRLRERAVQDRNWVMAVPEGTRDSKGYERWNASAACCGAEPGGPDDAAFLGAVLDDVARRTQFDAARVFALGVSNGGFLAHRLACDASERVRAIVSVAGAGPGARDAPCTPAKPVSVLQVHGALDETVGYAGGALRGAPYPGARASLEPWLRFPGCRTTRHGRSLHWFGPSVEIEAHACPAHRAELWTIPSGDHGLAPLRRAIPDLLDFLDGS